MASHPCRESEEEREEVSKGEEEEKEEKEKLREGGVKVRRSDEDKEKRFGDKSRFLPEVIDPNRVTIV